MAAHHQTSPAAALHGHHNSQPAQLPPNGHPPPPPAPGQGPHTGSNYDYLTTINTAIWVQIGRTAEVVGNNQIALEAYKRALQFNQWSVEALQPIANILRGEDKYQDAVEYIKTILKVDPNNGESYSALGHCYLMLDELQQAYSAYQSALYNLRDPKEPKLWYGIGILYDRYGSLDHAEEAFSQVMRMAPEFEKANEIYFRLGIIYKQQSKFRESLECFRYIVSDPPSPLNETDIWFQIGHVYEQQKDIENAKMAYHHVLERDPRHAKVLQQLGWLYHQQSNEYGHQQQAIEYLEKSVSSDGTDAQSWYLLGRCYMSQHKFPKAYEAYQQAVYRDGRNPTFWCSIGVLYYQINQYRDALDAYSRAIRLNPNISEVWYDLGTLYESCNNQTNDALDAYQRAAELDPSNQHIQARLQLLRNSQPSGISNPNGALQPQDVPPQHYKPTAAGGPPNHSGQWAASAPSGPSGPGPAPLHGSSSSQQGPPPPPLVAGSREWNQPGQGPPPPQSHLNDHHSAQSQGPQSASHQGHPQQQPPAVHPYDQRDPPRSHGGRQASPRQEPLRAPEPHRHTPVQQRHPSPSPRMRNAAPSYHRPQDGPPQSQGPPSSGPPPSHQHQQSHPSQQSTPLNRMPNPNKLNYGGQSHPPSAGPGSQGPLPPYGRPGSPPSAPEVRPIIDGRPPSPGSGYSHHHQHPYQHHADPNGPSNIASGAPPPNSAALAEAAAHRERDERASHHSAPSVKRHREWEDRDDNSETGSNKKMASDQARARLDDPYSARQKNLSPTSPHELPPIDRDRERGGPYSSLPSSQHGPPPSNTDGRRPGDTHRQSDEYKPSAVAHQPQPLNTTLHQEFQHTSPGEARVLPSINTGSERGANNNGPGPSTAPTSAEARDREEHKPTKMEIDQPHHHRHHSQQPPTPSQPQYQHSSSKATDATPPSAHQQEAPKRPEEPAARKMDVDENYDDDDDDDDKTGDSNKFQKAASNNTIANNNAASNANANSSTGVEKTAAAAAAAAAAEKRVDTQNGVSTNPAPGPSPTSATGATSEVTKVEASA